MVLTLLFSLGSCQWFKEQTGMARPTNVSFLLTGIQGVNNNSSVRVRYFQLREKGRFEKQTFKTLKEAHFKDYKGFLDADLISANSESRYVNAGNNHDINIPLNEETKYIAFFGRFDKEADDDTWKLCVPFEELQGNTVAVKGYGFELRKK